MGGPAAEKSVICGKPGVTAEDYDIVARVFAASGVTNLDAAHALVRYQSGRDVAYLP